MISEVKKDKVTYAPLPEKYEAGTMATAEVVAFNDIENCYYIGDSSKDIQSAKSAGIKSIACSYGYRIEDDDSKQWGADFHVNKPIEILNVI